jgi:ATP-dependent DNA ligase
MIKDNMIIKPMLASDFNKCFNSYMPTASQSSKLYAIEPKIDGIRVMVYADPSSGIITYHTRNGNGVSLPVSISPLIMHLASTLGSAVLFDCEAVGDAGNVYDTYSNLMGAHEGSTIKLVVLDIPYVAGWQEAAAVPYMNRYAALEDLFNQAKLADLFNSTHSLLTLIPQLAVGVSPADFSIQDYFEEAVAKGYEGIMIKDMEAPYLSGRRSKAWLKLKKKATYDCRIIGFTRGAGKYDGSAGAMLIDFNGNIVKVGSGLSDQLRQQLYDNPEQLVGKYAEVECQEITPSGMMRSPSLITIRYDK